MTNFTGISFSDCRQGQYRLIRSQQPLLSKGINEHECKSHVRCAALVCTTFHLMNLDVLMSPDSE